VERRILTETRIKAILDANRNSLMLLDLKFSIGTLGLATGTLISALYGMNLKNFIEESDIGFGLISAATIAFSAAVCFYGLGKLRKVQRVRMWGEGDMSTSALSSFPARNNPITGGRGSWRSDNIEPLLGPLPGEGRLEKIRRLRDTAAAATGEEARRAALMRAAIFSRSRSLQYEVNNRKSAQRNAGRE
jgi:magnesium transporter